MEEGGGKQKRRVKLTDEYYWRAKRGESATRKINANTRTGCCTVITVNLGALLCFVAKMCICLKFDSKAGEGRVVIRGFVLFFRRNFKTSLLQDAFISEIKVYKIILNRTYSRRQNY